MSIFYQCKIDHLEKYGQKIVINHAPQGVNESTVAQAPCQAAEGETTEAETETVQAAPPTTEDSLDQRIGKAIRQLQQLRLIDKKSDFLYPMIIMRETQGYPSFSSYQEYVDYLANLGIENLPSESTLQKASRCINCSLSFPMWEFEKKLGIGDRKHIQKVAQTFKELIARH